jgi:gluconolactonase
MGTAGQAGGGTTATGGTTAGGGDSGGTTSTGGNAMGGMQAGGTTAQGGSTMGGTGGMDSGAAPICPGGPYAASPLPENATANPVCSGFSFTEGAVWFADLGKVLFSDFDNGGYPFAGRILEYTPGGDCVEFAPAMDTNGLAISASGNILAARHADQSISEIDLTTKMATPLYGTYMAAPFSSPNDLTLRSDGNIYFTDPAYQQGPRDGQPVQAAYRVDPEGNVTRITIPDGDERRPNGITLSPDENTLYIAVVSPSQVLKYDVAGDGSVSNPTQFVDVSSDGMGVDCAGNLYITQGNVQVFSAEGTPLGSIALTGDNGGAPDPTNVAFGGPNRTTLFITGAGLFRSVELNIPGYPY